MVSCAVARWEALPRAETAVMRHHSSITSLSWIPSEPLAGSTKMAFEAALGHYDKPPLVAVSACRVASVDAVALQSEALLELSAGHGRGSKPRSMRS